MAHNRQNRGEHTSREFFTLGEHAIGAKRYRFRYDGRTYRIFERMVTGEGENIIESEETMLLDESDSRTAYDAWNHIKRPERFGGST